MMHWCPVCDTLLELFRKPITLRLATSESSWTGSSGRDVLWVMASN